MEKSSTTKFNEEEGSRFGWWFLAALMMSAVLHGIFFRESRDWKVRGITPESFDEIVPRTFRMKRVEIDPATLMEAPQKKTTVERVMPGSIPVPEEFPTAGVNGNGLTPSPSVDGVDVPTAVNATIAALEKTTAPENLSGIAVETSPGPIGDPLQDLKTAQGKNEETHPGFSSLDSLIEGNQPLSRETAPILMPTDLLFEYDDAILRKEAEMSLKKLATLMERNSDASIRIEGHTDSFGRDDYNYTLSLRRAEEVKRWLVANAALNPRRITTAGFGKTRLLVPATGSIGDQQLNRRVEIVITQGARKP